MEVTSAEWTGGLDSNRRVKTDTAYTLTMNVKIKDGRNVMFSLRGTTAYINDSDTKGTFTRLSDTTGIVTYTFPIIRAEDREAEQKAKDDAKKAALNANSMTMAEADAKVPLNNPITIVINENTVDRVATNPDYYSSYVENGGRLTTLDGEVIPEDKTGYSALRITSIIYDLCVPEVDSGSDPAFTQLPNVKAIWLSPNCDIEGFLNALPRGSRSQYDNSRNFFGSYDKVVLIPASLYPNGPTYSGNSPSCHVMLYDGDVYEAAKKGVSAARDWCTNHSYTARYIAPDRWVSYATCTASVKYYYSCAKCGKIENNSNHTFNPDTIGNGRAGPHSYSVKNLSDEHFVGLNANGDRVYLCACEYCGKDKRYHQLNMTIEELIRDTGPTTQAEYELVISRYKQWWAEGGSTYNKVMQATVDKDYVSTSFAVATATYVTAKTSGWAREDVNYASEEGLIDKSFLGNDYTAAINRLQFASIAVRMAEKMTGKSITPAPSGTFTDTDDEYVRKAYAAGITSGTGDGATFSPNGTLNRQQMAAFLYRTLQYVKDNSDTRYSPYASKLNQFSDAGQVADWARDAMAFMNAFEFIKGSDGKLTPGGSCTIEQAVIVALRSLDAGMLGWYQNIKDAGNYGIDTSVKHIYGDRIWITGVYTNNSGTLYGNCVDPYGHSSHINLEKNVAPIKDR